jgi:hypothetical protein
VTPAEAHGELRAVADQLLAVEDRLRAVWEAVPRSPDEDAMFEGKVPWDLATEIRTVVECVGEGQRLDLMLQRVDVASRQVGTLEGELSGLRSRRTSLVDERFGLQSRLEAMAAEVDASDPESLPVYEAMARQAKRPHRQNRRPHPRSSRTSWCGSAATSRPSRTAWIGSWTGPSSRESQSPAASGRPRSAGTS